MSNWRDGYVTDTEYTTAYYSQHSPVTIDAAQFFQRYRPVRNGPEFRYFELGCGTGLTSVLMAAGHPEAFFEANDFMPEHIVIAQDLATKLEIENVRFTDESFGDLNKRSHEPYDYIMAHGIYTWVSDARKLRSGNC
jgi:Methylase of polypeptide chain release factors